MPIVQFSEVYVSKGKGKIPISVEENEYGKIVRFRAAEPTWDGKYQSEKWRVWDFAGYDYIADKLLKMKVELGSGLKICGKIKCIPESEGKPERFIVSILDVDYLHSKGFRKKQDKQIAATLPLLPEKDPFIQNPPAKKEDED